MATTPEIQTSQGGVNAAIHTTTLEQQVDQGSVLAAANKPTPEMQVSEAMISATFNREDQMQINQGFVLVAAAGRTQNFNIRAWTFTMDGHDFYVLHLGEQGTIVYDVLTQQWMTWESMHRDTLVWKAATGTPWNAVQNFNGNSDGIAGDDTTGMLYWINASQAYDSTNGIDPNSTQEDFQRILTGGIPERGRGTTPCNFVFLTGSLGSPYPGSQVNLRTSDDLGKTWQDNGYITVDPANWTQDVTWYSLGMINAPGRIFEVVDNGVFERIDSLDMN